MPCADVSLKIYRHINEDNSTVIALSLRCSLCRFRLAIFKNKRNNTFSAALVCIDSASSLQCALTQLSDIVKMKREESTQNTSVTHSACKLFKFARNFSSSGVLHHAPQSTQVNKNALYLTTGPQEQLTNLICCVRCLSTCSLSVRSVVVLSWKR
jgi:hypothetical protein